MNIQGIDQNGESGKLSNSGEVGSTSLENSPPSPPLEPPDSTQQTAQPESVSPTQDFAAQRLDRVESSVQQVLAQLGQLSNDFDTKLKYDAQKEESVARLHRELQEYKDDLLAKITRPLINDLITLYDNITKTCEYHRERIDDLKQEDYVKSLEFFKQYVIDILEKHDVFQFQSPSIDFDPKTQQALEVLRTDDADQAKKIGKRLRVGFRYLDRIVRPEGVAVFRLDPSLQTRNDDVKDKP